MKIKRLLSVIVFITTVSFSVHAQYTFSNDVKDHKNNIITGNDTSHVNWTVQYIEAKGWSVMDTSRFKVPGQALAMARRGAIVDAQRNLLERIAGVRITGETVVKDMITEKDYVYSRLEGVLKGAELIGEPYVDGTIVEVTMRVPIYESTGDGSVAGVIQDAMDVKPEVTKEELEEFDPGETQIAFNINGEMVDPALFPQIIDEQGNIVLDMSKYYNMGNGNFPKYLKLSKEVLSDAGFQKGVEVIDLIQDSEGRFKIDPDKLPGNKKINWRKVGLTIAKVGGFILKMV